MRAAIEHDDPARLVRLLRCGVAPVYRDQDDGWSPLHHAVDVEADFSHEAGTSRDLRLVRPLIDAGAEVNAVWTSPGGVAKTPRTSHLTICTRTQPPPSAGPVA